MISSEGIDMGKSGIDQRKFTFCSSFDGYPVNRLFVQCSKCTRFYGACCMHGSVGGDSDRPEGPAQCHYTRLVFSDGACSNNGRYGAQAGMGITIGDDDDYRWSIAVDDEIDFVLPRTSQRTELLAAIEGLYKLGEIEDHGDSTDSHIEDEEDQEGGAQYIVVTDSEYVVKGITEWFPSWRKRGWRTSAGNKPANLDLFKKLDEYASSLEHDGIGVGFLHVRREFNQKADALAKRAIYA